MATIGAAFALFETRGTDESHIRGSL